MYAGLVTLSAGCDLSPRKKLPTGPSRQGVNTKVQAEQTTLPDHKRMPPRRAVQLGHPVGYHPARYSIPYLHPVSKSERQT